MKNQKIPTCYYRCHSCNHQNLAERSLLQIIPVMADFLLRLPSVLESHYQNADDLLGGGNYSLHLLGPQDAGIVVLSQMESRFYQLQTYLSSTSVDLDFSLSPNFGCFYQRVTEKEAEFAYKMRLSMVFFTQTPTSPSRFLFSVQKFPKMKLNSLTRCVCDFQFVVHM